MNLLAHAHGELGTTAIDDLIMYKTVRPDAEFASRAAINLVKDTYAEAIFHRTYNAKTALTKFYFEYSMADLDPVGPSNKVYDWRLGVPALLELISWRIQFIAALDPNFRTSGQFDGEITKYIDAIQSHYVKMLKGVKCGFRYSGKNDTLVLDPYMCGDIYSGFSAAAFFDGRRNGMLRVSYDGKNFVAEASEDEILAKLESVVKRRMPLFQMQAMINTLTLYNHRSLDLTEKNHRIPVYGAPKLCLDTEGGNVTAGTNVMLHECNGSDGQTWVYNRESDTISNPVSGLCLDVAWESPVPGMGVGLWHCTGHDSQQWTYNRVTHVLQNKLGTVLDIQWGNLQAGTPVWSWPLNGGRAQQWRAD
jgi:hypothetical protein